MKKVESLKSSIEFKSVYNTGNSKANKYLVMYVSKNQLGINRVGISVSKKVGNSVVRHRLKRIIKEVFRLHQEVFNSGLDIVIVVRNSASLVGYHELDGAVMHLCKLHHIIKANDEVNSNL